MPYLIYDVEIENAIPDKGGEPDPAIRYCEGWGDHAGMGVALVGCYDAVEDRFLVYDRSDLAEFAELVRLRGYRVGWNNARFDDRVLAAAGCDLAGDSIDLLALAQRQTGFAKGWRLGDVADRVMGGHKAGDSACVPALWQQGRVAAVARHVLQDVALTRLVFEYAIRMGHLPGPDGGPVSIDLPAGLRLIGAEVGR